MGKPDSSNLTHALCFNCAAIFPVLNNPSKKCPQCGYSPAPEQYSAIINYAISAVYYGHDYRQRYEQQLNEKGEIKVVYALPEPSIILTFLAVSALSGIIGSISYDIVKSAFRMILRKAKKSQDNIGQNKINFTDESAINIFIGQINEFNVNFQNINPAVKSEIEEEMLAWSLSNAITSEIKEGSLTKEAIHNAFKKGFENAEHPQKPSAEDFGKFWKEIDKEDA